MSVVAVRSVFLLMISSLVWENAVLAADTAHEVRRVVTLNSTDPYLPAFLLLDGAQREAIVAQSRAPVEFYAEALDMHRFPRKLLDEDLAEMLRRKYRGLKVDVVTTTAAIALDFAQRHRAEIWPGAAIVFDSVPADWLEGRSLAPRTTGLPVRLEFGKTLELALKLRPTTRRIVVVAGGDEPCCGRTAIERRIFDRYARGRKVEYLVGLPLAETVAAVQELPEEAVVIYLSMFRDGAGVPHVPRDVLEKIAAVSPVPVFGLFETFLGHGIAAGTIASFQDQGRVSGELVARVLNGQDPATIGVVAPVASRCTADWRQLKHWGIDESLLPADCELRFKPVTVWDRYHWQILTVLGVILMQAALIAVLMLNRRARRNAQSALKEAYARRIEAESLAARLRGRIARFSKERSLGAMATTIAHEINQPLIAIQNYAQAARRRLQGDVHDKPRLIELVAKIEGQAERAGTITQRVRSLVNSDDPQLIARRLYPLLEEVIRMMEPEMENRGCRIEFNATSDAPVVFADALQIQLVLVNLLQNSMQSVCGSDQYEKRICIDVRSLGDREVQVSVTDKGPGVAAARVTDIFDSLYSGRSGGLGMGLSISKSIVEAHGGRLWYEPNPAGGACFHFTLQVVEA
jgi:signal transduction histidine kinase